MKNRADHHYAPAGNPAADARTAWAVAGGVWATDRAVGGDDGGLSGLLLLLARRPEEDLV